jgi:hypothetical protein
VTGCFPYRKRLLAAVVGSSRPPIFALSLIPMAAFPIGSQAVTGAPMPSPPKRLVPGSLSKSYGRGDARNVRSLESDPHGIDSCSKDVSHSEEAVIPFGAQDNSRDQSRIGESFKFKHWILTPVARAEDLGLVGASE